MSAGVQQELIDWRVVDLQNQGKHTGTLLFPIPTEIAQSFYRWEYKLSYAGNRTYNIRWEQLRVTMTSIDVAASELREVSLADGGSVRGKLAFSILPEMASDRAKYRFMYTGETPVRNVQWFDSPDRGSRHRPESDLISRHQDHLRHQLTEERGPGPSLFDRRRQHRE